MSAIIIQFPLELKLKNILKERIIECLERAERYNYKVYMNTLYVDPKVREVRQDRAFINEVVDELSDDGYVFIENMFASLRLTDKLFKKA